MQRPKVFAAGRFGLLAVLVLAAFVPAVAHAAFPGADGKIAYSHESHTFVADPNTGVKVDLTPNDPRYFFPFTFPSWSSDGQKLIFGAGTIETMSPDGSARTALFSGAIPALSPDSGRIAFIRSVSIHGNSDIFISNVDGSGLVDLTADFSPTNVSDTDPVWSPDGTRIAFTSSKNGPSTPGAFEIFTIRPDGSDPVKLTDGSRDFAPDWSPDGTRIVFFRFDGPDSDRDSDLWVMNSDGSGQRRLTAHTDVDEEYPAWSPDGSKIAFDRQESEIPIIHNIWVVNADGTGERRLIENGREPAWQPIPGPRRSDYQNAAQFCQADRDFLGDEAFRNKYATNPNAANAFGKCVSAG